MIANSPTKFAEYLASGLPILTNTGIGDSDEILREPNGWASSWTGSNRSVRKGAGGDPAAAR